LFTSRFTLFLFKKKTAYEIKTLIGRYLAKQLLYSELKRMIEEALLCNPYITSLSDFQVEQKGSQVTCLFAVNTIYGNVAQSYIYQE
jgi:hypothetical protein